MIVNGRRISSMVLAAAITVLWSMPSVAQDNDLAFTFWRLAAIKEKDGRTLTPADKSRYTLVFEYNGRLKVQVDCNSGSATWQSDGPGQVRFGPLALTKKMCPRGSLHNRIVPDWSSIRTFKKNSEKLSLTTADGVTYEFETMVSLEADTALFPSIYGSTWRLSRIDGRDVGMTKAFLQFDRTDARFSGDGGCNRISGNIVVDRNKIKFSNAISTKRACVDRRMQEIENSFFASLEQVNAYEVSDTQLTLKTGIRPVLIFISGRVEKKALVTGTIRYLQRSALPATAEVEVKLLDESYADESSWWTGNDRPGAVVDRVWFKTEGRQVPLKFDMTYDLSKIDVKTRYLIRVRIFDRNRLLFYNTTDYAVITLGNPDTVKVIVKPPPRR